MMTPPALTPLLTFSPRAIVWLWLRGIPPALTFVLTFISVLPLWLLTLNIERRRRVLDFEAGDQRRPPLQAGSGRQKNHRREIFLRGAAIGAIAAALDC